LDSEDVVDLVEEVLLLVDVDDEKVFTIDELCADAPT